MRVQRLRPATDWVRVWHNLHEAPVSEDIKVIWYRAIHDIYPTHEQLHRINMTTSPICRHCNMADELKHRIMECGEGHLLWDWTKGRLARILRTTGRQVPDAWVLRPNFSIWPPKRRRAVLWLLANFVAFQMQWRDTLTSLDCYDFLRRGKWKLQQATRWNERVGNHLCVLEEDFPQGVGHTWPPRV
jgi:hypothetical protein